MSMPVSQLPPAVTIAQDSFTTHSSSHGAVGPVIAVLVVIMVLGIIAIMIGRVCSGRRIFGYGHYDIENWAETHCSSCIDGRLTPPCPPSSSHPNTSALPSTPMPIPPPHESHPEIKNEEEEEEQEDQHHPPENL